MPLPGSTPNDSVAGVTGKGTPIQPRDINPIRPDDDVAFAASELLNSGGVAEGTNLPPQQSGQYRVPIPGGFQVQGSTPSFGGSIVTLTWQDIDPSRATVSHYNVYVQLAYDSNQAQSLVGASDKSPCVCRVIASKATNVTFWLQPVLTNGLSLPVDACPTCTTTLPDPTYVITLNDPATGDMVTLSLSNNIPIGGTTRAGLGVHDNTTGLSTSVASGIVVTFNGNGKQMDNFGFGGAGPGQHGLIEANDGTGSGGINGAGGHFRAVGDTGQVTSLSPSVGASNFIMKDGTNEVDMTCKPVGGTPTPTGYLQWTLNGSTIYIPYSI